MNIVIYACTLLQFMNIIIDNNTITSLFIINFNMLVRKTPTWPLETSHACWYLTSLHRPVHCKMTYVQVDSRANNVKEHITYVSCSYSIVYWWLFTTCMYLHVAHQLQRSLTVDLSLSLVPNMAVRVLSYALRLEF